MQPKKLTLQSANGADINLEALYRIAPSCFTEVKDEKTGELRHVVNFTTLRQLLGDNAVDNTPEMYQFIWPGKNEARQEAARPTTKTLRPVQKDSVDWDNTQNIYIEGDNLEVLKLLQKGYMGKVKMIYIDPPYNTGNDFVYDDDFATTQQEQDLAEGNVDELGNRYRKNTDSNGKFHSDWCSMIYPRLQIAQTLLSNDGVIFISLDDKEVGNLFKICNEIFGEKNFVGNIVWQSRTSISNDDEISTNHNHTLVYSKDRGLLTFGGDDIDASDYINPDNDPRGPWKLVPIDANHVGGDTNYPIKNPKTGVDYYPPTGRIWCYNRQTMEKLLTDGRIKFGLTDDSSPKRKLFYKERLAKGDVKTPSSILLDAGTTKSGTSEIMSLFDGLKIFDYPKPSTLIKRFMQYGYVQNGDIVLDFFSGSGTIAQACFNYNQERKKNVKFIAVQLQEDLDKSLAMASTDAKKTIKVALQFLEEHDKPHTIPEIAKERIRRAGKKIKEDSPLTTQDLDIGFRVFRLADSNMEDVYFSPKDYKQDKLGMMLDNVKADRNDLDLLFGAMLDWGVQLSLPMTSEEVDGKTIYTVNNGDLVACFEPDVTEAVVAAMADKMPLRVLFRDSCFAKDDVKINIFETLKQKLDWSEETAMNCIRVI